MTKKDITKLKERLEHVPTNGNDDKELVNGRLIDLSVAISLKRIADGIEQLVTALAGGRRRT